MSQGNRLMRAFVADEKLMDKLHEQIVKDTRRYRKALAKGISSQLDKLVLQDGKVLPTPQNQQALLEFLMDTGKFLDETGYPRLVKGISETMNKRLSTANRMMQQAGIEQAVIQTDFANLPDIAKRIQATSKRLSRGEAVIASRLQDALLSSSIFGGVEGMTKEALARVLINTGASLAHYAHTVANTELMSLDRTVRMKQALNAGLTHMRYTGPVDKVTRDFCLEYIGRVEPMQFWEVLENPTGPQPVIEFCGGYNCRHRLLPWNPEWDLS